MSAYAGPEIVNSGLVLHLDAGNTNSYTGSGSLWTDLSGRGNTGNLVNGPTYSTNNRGRLTFDGTNQVVTIPLNLNYTAGAIIAWINIASNNNKNFFVYSANNPTSTFTHQLGITTDNKLSVYMYDNASKLTKGTTTLSLNKWYHLTFWWKDNNFFKSYINGTEETSTAMGVAWKSGSNFWLASNCGPGLNAYNYFQGSFGVCQVYNREITVQEIRQNFEATRDRYGV